MKVSVLPEKERAHYCLLRAKVNDGHRAEGVYVWKVMVEGKEVEIGKWVKE